MIAENVHHGSMFGKDRFEGRDMTWNMVFNHAEIPLAEEALQRFCKVWAHRPRCTKGRGTWGRLALPPGNGVVGAGLPFHQAMVLSMAWSDKVR